MRGLIAMAAVAAVCASGCSWLFMEPPPSPYDPATDGRPHCTRAAVAPTIDGIFAGLDFGSAIYSGLRSARGEDVHAATVVVPAISGVVFLVSSLTGAAWSSDCRDTYLKFDGIEPAGIPGEEASGDCLSSAHIHGACAGDVRAAEDGSLMSCGQGRETAIYQRTDPGCYELIDLECPPRDVVVATCPGEIVEKYGGAVIECRAESGASIEYAQRPGEDCFRRQREEE